MQSRTRLTYQTKANAMQKPTTNPAPTQAATAKSQAKAKPQADAKANAKAKAASAPKTDKAAERAALATRIAAERKTAGAVFSKLSDAVSVPIKPLSAYSKTYKRNVTAHAIGRGPSPRQAAALYVALIAANGKLANGATFPRKFDIRGVSYAVENGVLSSAISAGLCTYDTKAETITLRNANELQSQIKTTGFKL